MLNIIFRRTSGCKAYVGLVPEMFVLAPAAQVDKCTTETAQVTKCSDPQPQSFCSLALNVRFVFAAAFLNEIFCSNTV